MNLQEYNDKYHQGQKGTNHLTDPIGEFYEICKFGDIEAVKFLLHSNEAPTLPNIHEQVRRAMNAACESNHLELVKYLFTLEKSHNIIIKEQLLFYSLDNACRMGNLDILDFFLLPVNKSEKPKVSLDKYGSSLLITAVREGQNKSIDYLLLNERFKTKINIHHDNDMAFKYALSNNNLELIKHFIIHLNIEKTKDIEDFITNDLPSNKVARKMFEVREMNLELNNQLLDSKSIINKKTKL